MRKILITLMLAGLLALATVVPAFAAAPNIPHPPPPCDFQFLPDPALPQFPCLD